jgi:DNA-binding transcriptional ArsR family regulator
MARVSASGSSTQPYRLPGRGRSLPVVQQQPHDCVVALRALGEDTRVRIVGLLIDHPLDVGAISDALGVSPYNVSKHLRVLREAGLLEVEKEGRLRRYALPEAIRREAAAGRVLDLGCCSFQFAEDAAPASRPAAPPRPASAKTGRARRR